MDQDPLGVPGYRLVGSDLSYPCGGGALPSGALYQVQAVPCDDGDALQQWTVHGNGSYIQLSARDDVVAVLDAYQCGTADDTAVYVDPLDNGQGTCGTHSAVCH